MPRGRAESPTPVPAVDPLLADPIDPIQPMPLLSIPAQARDRPVLNVRALRKPRSCDRPLPHDDLIGYTTGLHGREEPSRQTRSTRTTGSLVFKAG